VDLPHVRRLRVALVTTACLVAVVAAVSFALPATRLDIVDPRVRILLEAAGAAVVLIAAVVLLLVPTPVGGRDDGHNPRNAIVAALLTLAGASAVLGTGAFLDAAGGGATLGLFYPWLASRYVAGLLFLVGATNRPRLRLRTLLLLAAAVLAAAEAAIALAGRSLPLPIAALPAGDAVELVVTAPVLYGVLELVPAALFALGALLATRLHARTASPLDACVAVALVVQVGAQVLEPLSPAILGPRITTPDVLRGVTAGLLLLGAVVQARHLQRDHRSAVMAQREDLRTQRRLIDALRRYSAREEDVRAIVSHELATPIATLRAFGHVLAHRVHGTDDPDVKAAAAGIVDETRRLQELVERIDELRDLELAEFTCDLRPVRLRPLLEDAARLGRTLHPDHIFVVAAPDVRVDADPVRLGQALRNLVLNAATYAPERTTVCVDAHIGSGRARIAVTDEGPGVDPDDAERLTHKFTRGDSGADGTGLGLYVARRIAEAHGGTLRLGPAGGPPSRPGARAVIDLPLDAQGGT
jgi:signal transduction histidine kinase